MRGLCFLFARLDLTRAWPPLHSMVQPLCCVAQEAISAHLLTEPVHGPEMNPSSIEIIEGCLQVPKGDDPQLHGQVVKRSTGALGQIHNLFNGRTSCDGLFCW